jgi:NTE family protein
VLGAGGSVGIAYHGAVLSVLEEVTGWDPRDAELMVGTSAGSVTAAMLRAGVPAGDLARISEGEPLSEEGEALAAVGRPRRPRPSRSDAFSFRPVADPVAVVRGLACPWSSSPKAVAVASLPAGGIPTDAISSGIDAVYDGRWPSKPLWLCAWDLRAGKRVVFGRPGAPPATVGQAVAASCAIPMYFKPVVIGGRRYVDGGVSSMVNLDLVADRGLDLVIAVAPMSQAPAWGPLSLGVVMRQGLRSRLRSEMAELRRRDIPVVAIQPGRSVITAMGLNPMDAARRGGVSLATRAGMKRWLRDGPEGRQLVRLLRVASGRSAPDLDSDAQVRRDLA